jgi:RNA polymerase sigma-70 factor (ECF subfamily)
MPDSADRIIPTRYSLLSRLKNWDDQESWKVFFDTYWRLIYGVAVKAGLSDAEAQDVVQETVITVAKQIHKFKRDRSLGSFKGWLRNLTRWRIGDQLRKRGPAFVRAAADQDETTDALDRLADESASALDSVWEAEWRENLLAAALDRVKKKVKEEHYQIFNLYVVKKWPVAKVAKALGVNIPRVYLAKHRVGALIRKEVQRLEKTPI